MKLLLSILVLTLSFQLGAQNLVPNPSFEDTVQFQWGEVTESLGWYSSRQSPDVYHGEWASPMFQVPYNICGFQFASTGVAYGALCTYFQNVNYREIIGVDLITPLTIGTTYYFCMKVSPTVDSVSANSLATNNLGALFSTIQYTGFPEAPINNFAHINETQILSDTAIWVDVSGTFVADSNYTFLMVGNFFDDVNTDTLAILDLPQWSWAYYYVDDICVSENPLTCCNEGGVGLQELNKQGKHLVKVVDMMGREAETKQGEVLLYIYSDGTVEKVFNVE